MELPRAKKGFCWHVQDASAEYIFCPKESYWFCVQCSAEFQDVVTYCPDHWDANHTGLRQEHSAQDPTQMQLYLNKAEYENLVYKILSPEPASSAEMQNWFKMTTFTDIDPRDFQLTANYPAFHRAWLEIQQMKLKVPLVTVAAIAPSGSGKSALLDLLLEIKGGSPAYRPRPSAAGDIVSQTKGIHGFIARQSLSNSDPQPVLYLDLEGSGGSPTTEEEFARKLFSVGKAMLVGSGPESEVQRRHRRYVNKAFPRLAYMFADVVIYPARSARESQTVVEYVLAYASAASAGSVRACFQPSLVLVFNFCTPEQAERYQTPESIKEWFDLLPADLYRQLFSVFQHVDVVFIPMLQPGNSKAFDLFWEAVNRFADVVMARLARHAELKAASPLLASADTLFELWQEATRRLNADPNGPLNLFSLLPVRVGPGFGGSIELLLKKMVTAAKEDPKAIAAAVRRINRLLRSLWLYQFEPSVAAAVAFHLDETWTEALMRICAGFEGSLRCQARHTFFDEKSKQNKVVQCELIQEQHLDLHQHQSTETYHKHQPLLKFFSQYPLYPCHWVDENQGFVRPVFQVEIELEEPKRHGIDRQLRNALAQLRDVALPTFDRCSVCFAGCPVFFATCAHGFCRRCSEWVVVASDGRCPIDDAVLPDLPPFLSTARVVTFDGGGVRGAVQATLIEEIEKQTRFPFSRSFNVLAGTSVGAIIAAYLFLHGAKTLRELEAWPKIASLSQTLFGKPLVPEPLRKAFCTLFDKAWYSAQQLRAEVKTLLGPECEKPLHAFSASPQLLFIPSIASSKNSALYLFTNRNSEPAGRYTICTEVTLLDAVVASASAPSYFDACELVIQGEVIRFVDGGLGYNNPCRIVRDHLLHSGVGVDYLLSLGNGGFPGAKEKRGHRLVSAIGQVFDIVTDAQSAFEEVRDSLPCRRLNPVLGKAFALDDARHLEEMRGAALGWLQKQPLQLVLDDLIACLLDFVVERLPGRLEARVELVARPKARQALIVHFGAERLHDELNKASVLRLDYGLDLATVLELERLAGTGHDRGLSVGKVAELVRTGDATFNILYRGRPLRSGGVIVNFKAV